MDQHGNSIEGGFEHSAIVKECGCGAAYDFRAWNGLPHAAGGRELTALGGGEFLEWRNCTSCGSTLGRAFTEIQQQLELSIIIAENQRSTEKLVAVMRATRRELVRSMTDARWS